MATVASKRIRFVVGSVLLGCLALLLGLGWGRTQNPAAPPANRGQTAPPQRPPSPTPAASANTGWIDERFRRLDRNGDGFLTADEMTENLRAELHKWDVNGDAMIDLDEWREYVQAVVAHRKRTAAAARSAARAPGQKPGRKLVWAPRPRKPAAQGGARPPFRPQRNQEGSSRVFKLPSNIPKWFKEYDADGDGQVSLAEWMEKEDEEREFWKYDLNKDGLITFDELIRSGQFTPDNKMMPQRVNQLKAEIGEFFYFEVTGTTGGGLWGTNIYTADSLISTAAVHAGILRPGETGLVKVTILSGQRQHLGTTQNGVTSNPFGPFPRSYRIEAVAR
jgi:Ca2+-binding EF-hand superfamily protein